MTTSIVAPGRSWASSFLELLAKSASSKKTSRSQVFALQSRLELDHADLEVADVGVGRLPANRQAVERISNRLLDGCKLSAAEAFAIWR